jgi:hypothetical protein
MQSPKIIGHSDQANTQTLADTEHELTDAEIVEFRSLEATVEQGLRAFWQIGQALRQIRDKRLYRQDYRTFEDYCLARWEISRRSAYQLIEAASVVENVRHGAQIIPANERQARPLTALKPEQQQAAWAKAVSTAPSGKVTAAHVAQIAQEYRQQSARTANPPSGSHSRTDGSSPPEAQTNYKSCWNCSHCSLELLDDPQTFYCNQFGVLNFIEKDGNQRGAECELWTARWAKSDETKRTRILKRETFTLTLQLPAHLQPLLRDTAKAEGLVAVDWAAQVLEAAISANRSVPSEAILDVSEAARNEGNADSEPTQGRSEGTAAA